MERVAGQTTDPESSSGQEHALSSNVENVPEHGDSGKLPSSTASMYANGPATQQPSRIPMTGLSQNAQCTSPAASRVLLPKAHSKIPERPASYLASLRSSGNTTHRESRPTSPGMWHNAGASGALTARGSCPVLPSSIPKPPARLAVVSTNHKSPSGAAARAAALNAQAVPYVPHGGSSPSIQDSTAHAEAALHMLKQVAEKEAWHRQGIDATVQKKEAELQSLQHELDKLASKKQAGLDRLRQLSGQQQHLHEQLDQAHHESTSGNRQLERLQRENRALQDGLADAQHAAQQLLPENHAVLLEARSLRHRQAHLQSSVDSLRAAKVSAQQECSMYESMCTALEVTFADSSTAAEVAESALSQHKATAGKLLQQCVSLLGLSPEQLFPGLVQKLQDEIRNAYEDRLKTAERKAVLAQADSAIASAQNTSRSQHHAHSAAPAISLDLKSLSLKETFQSLIDSSRDKTASARTASAHTASGLSARQPMSARDRHPVVPSPSKVVNTLASLSEEPGVSNNHGHADGNRLRRAHSRRSSMESGNPAHPTEVQAKHGSFTNGSVSSRDSKEFPSAGSTDHGSSRSSSYYSSCNSSGSSSPTSDANEAGVSGDAHDDQVHKLDKRSSSQDSIHKSPAVTQRGSKAPVASSLSGRLRLPLLPIGTALSSKGATPRSVRFQLQNNTHAGNSAAQHTFDQQTSGITASQPGDARANSASMLEGVDGMKHETSFVFSANAEAEAAVGCRLDSCPGTSDTLSAVLSITVDHEASTGAAQAALHAPLLLATTHAEGAQTTSKTGKDNASGEDEFEARLKQMRQQLETTWNIFEEGRQHCRVRLPE